MRAKRNRYRPQLRESRFRERAALRRKTHQPSAINNGHYPYMEEINPEEGYSRAYEEGYLAGYDDGYKDQKYNAHNAERGRMDDMRWYGRKSLSWYWL